MSPYEGDGDIEQERAEEVGSIFPELTNWEKR